MDYVYLYGYFFQYEWHSKAGTGNGFICFLWSVMGQFDFILISFFNQTCHMSAAMSTFMSIFVGTAITMYIHIKILGNTMLGFMPFIFAGVCLTFSQEGGNVAGLAFTLFVGILLAAICGAGLNFFSKRFETE